jgi:hypothetical protein
MFLTFAICFETAVIIFHIGDFGTMIVHTEDGDEVAESPIFPRTEFIPGLGSINSFTHDPKRAELISSFWYEKYIYLIVCVFSHTKQLNVKFLFVPSQILCTVS